jgi:hypothetical protein
VAAGKEPLAEPADPMIGGLSVWQWFRIFTDTHVPNGMGAFMRMEWPEAGGYADQPECVKVGISEVCSALMKEAARSAK